METKKDFPRVLLVSDATWADNNNIGNTFSNLFGNWDPEKIAMVYARADLPDGNVCKRYFQIAEGRMIKSLMDKSVKTGVEIEGRAGKALEVDMEADEASGKKLYSTFKKFRWNIFLMARDMLWRTGKWKTIELDSFIDSFQPDVIFLLACEGDYMNKLQRYIVDRTGRKGAIYFVDDIYSINRVSLSPFFWIQKLISRRSIKKTVDSCEKIYTIVSKQKEEYDSYFERESEVINKGGNFDGSMPDRSTGEFPLKMIFTGNIFAGRWETLSRIGKALDSINVQSEKAILYIYTQNSLEPSVKRAFDSSKSIKFMGSIPSSDVKAVQSEGDILVHVESFRLQDRLSTRLSFSTKLVDYFERGRCIFAIGWSEAASISYLRDKDGAVVVDDLENLEREVERLVSDIDRVREYGEKGWNCGRENHRIEEIRERLFAEMVNLSEK